MKHDARGTMDDKMWIKRMPDDYFNHPSFCCDDVMLWQNGKIYVMDNHRDATWCWFHQCRDGERYNFMHIDRHYDMGDYYYDEDLEPIKANPRMEYEAYANLKRVDDFLTLRWDNYIRLAYELRPEWFQTNIFLTQKEGDICEGWHKNRMNISEKDSLFLLAHMNQYLLEMSECLYDVAPDSHELKWIVNLDLDMFFYHDGGESSADKGNIKAFGLKGLYAMHDDYVKEIIEKAAAYDKTARQMIADTFQKRGYSPDQVFDFVWGKYLDDAQYENRVLSKLTKDLLEQLKIRK